MISGFSGAPRQSYESYGHNHAGTLPMPFNLPNVLHNLLFEDVGLEFDAKQKDIMEALRFSYNALIKMQKNYALQEQALREKILHDSDNLALKDEYEEMQLDMFDASHQFKDLVVVISELLTREQYAKLMAFSNIAL